MEQTGGEGPRPETKVTASKIRFLGPDMAIEDGASEVVLPDAKGAPPVRGHFHAVWVKQDGHWRLTSLCEVPIGSAAESRLSDLDWMVGTWTADSDGTKLKMTVQWNVTNTFLLHDMKATRDGKVVLRSSQRIGRDPVARKLKSWSLTPTAVMAMALGSKTATRGSDKAPRVARRTSKFGYHHHHVRWQE